MIDELENLELELGAEIEEETLPEASSPDESMAADETPAPDAGGVSAPSTEPGAEPAGEVQPDTEPVPGPVEVISVDELLERLANSASPEEEAGEPEEEPEESPEESTEPEEAAPSTMEITGENGGPVIVRGMEGAAESLEALQDTIHPALTTPFSEYTVTEALLLLLFLAVFLSACYKLLRGAFVWLRS